MDKQKLLTDLSTTALQIVLPLALTAITAYGLKVLHRLQKKYGLQLEEADQAKVDRVVADAIRAAEETFTAKLKANPAANVTAADKHAMAVMQVMQNANLPYTEASNAIQAMLPKVGLGATAVSLTPVSVTLPFGTVAEPTR